MRYEDRTPNKYGELPDVLCPGCGEPIFPFYLPDGSVDKCEDCRPTETTDHKASKEDG